MPLNDASVDAVIGTLVLCSVTDVHRTLQGTRLLLGSFLSFVSEFTYVMRIMFETYNNDKLKDGRRGLMS